MKKEDSCDRVSRTAENSFDRLTTYRFRPEFYFRLFRKNELKQEFFYFIYVKIKIIVNINMTKPSTNRNVE